MFATFYSEGIPNIVPVHSKHLVTSNEVMITDQFMKKSRENVTQTCYGELMIKEGKEVYRISGRCEYADSGSLYEKAAEKVAEYVEKSKNRKISIYCKGIVLLKVDSFEIVSIC